MDIELKAAEIYNKHADLYRDDFPNWEEKAKEHALITVGEILNSTPFKLGFWMDVKLILQKY